MKISGLILAKNEEDSIAEALKCLEFADEIIVLDQNSTDKTAQIAQKLGAKVLSSKIEQFDKNRNTLKELAKGEWLFYLDADERVSKNNIDEIKKAVNENKFPAYFFPRKNYILGKFLKHGGFYPDYVPRLFKKSRLMNWEGKVHESPKVDGKFGYLKEPIEHKTARSMKQMLEKSTKWAKIEADLYDKKGTSKVNALKVLKFSFLEFIKRYFLKLGFLDGRVGLISTVYQAIHNAMILTYLWEIQNDSQKTAST